jgi:predicted nucleic-acid-binding Zn-ribbon protein
MEFKKRSKKRGDILEPRAWQLELRSRLEKEAFLEKYPCIRCGSKDKIHIHHLLYTGEKEDFFDKRFWVPLCERCHYFAHSTKYKSILNGEKRGWLDE